jgi:hypothetical protein
MEKRSLGGAYYFFIFIDDYAKYTWVYFLRNKSDVLKYFKEFKNMVEKKIGKYIKILDHIKGESVQILQNSWNCPTIYIQFLILHNKMEWLRERT